MLFKSLSFRSFLGESFEGYVLGDDFNTRYTRLKSIMHKNKASLVDVVHEHVGGSKAQAERAVDGVIDAIVKTLKEGGEVSIAGLGIFSTKQRAARTARNPKTGEAISVPSMRVPKFRPAKALKEAVK